MSMSICGIQAAVALGLTSNPSYRDIKPHSVVPGYVLDDNHEVVDVYVAEPVAHTVSVRVLKEAGMLILSDDGIKISYC